jgi:hypothetical protein
MGAGKGFIAVSSVIPGGLANLISVIAHDRALAFGKPEVEPPIRFTLRSPRYLQFDVNVNRLDRAGREVGTRNL